MKPYTYYISWSKISKHYYGVKYGQDANPDTFWKEYFTSSKYVREIREKHGEPDIIQVRRTFDCPEKAVEWEGKVINRMGMVLNEDYLNLKNIGKYSGGPISETARKNISKSAKIRADRLSRKFVFYSTLMDKTFTYNSWQEMNKELGVTCWTLKNIERDGEWRIVKRQPSTRHPFQVGDIIYLKDSTY